MSDMRRLLQLVLPHWHWLAAGALFGVIAIVSASSNYLCRRLAPADHRLALLEDLHQGNWMVVIGQQDVPGSDEVLIRIEAPAYLVPGNIELG